MKDINLNYQKLLDAGFTVELMAGPAGTFTLYLSNIFGTRIFRTSIPTNFIALNTARNRLATTRSDTHSDKAMLEMLDWIADNGIKADDESVPSVSSRKRPRTSEQCLKDFQDCLAKVKAKGLPLTIHTIALVEGITAREARGRHSRFLKLIEADFSTKADLSTATTTTGWSKETKKRVSARQKNLLHDMTRDEAGRLVRKAAK